jgi:hypothetical protein
VTKYKEVVVRKINIPAEKATELRALLRRAAKHYEGFENDNHEIRKRIAELVGPLTAGEYPALCKHSDRIEVVSHDEYLSDVNKERWH